MNYLNLKISLFLVSQAVLLSACGSGPSDTTGTLSPYRATSRPYQINGTWYYPQRHYEYDETGTASLYGGGDSFHGKPTATGERFDKSGLTAAHKTLPLPCVAKVTNLANGRVVIVKVNDRGPYVGDRIIDLSRQSAKLLGFERKGTAKVRVETLVDESLELNGLKPGQKPIKPHKTKKFLMPSQETVQDIDDLIANLK